MVVTPLLLLFHIFDRNNNCLS